MDKCDSAYVTAAHEERKHVDVKFTATKTNNNKGCDRTFTGEHLKFTFTQFQG